MRSQQAVSSSLITGMNSLRLNDDIIEEGEEEASPHNEPERGVVLSSLQQKLGISPPSGSKLPTKASEEMDDLDLSGALDEEDELQFELS